MLMLPFHIIKRHTYRGTYNWHRLKSIKLLALYKLHFVLLQQQDVEVKSNFKQGNTLVKHLWNQLNLITFINFKLCHGLLNLIINYLYVRFSHHNYNKMYCLAS